MNQSSSQMEGKIEALSQRHMVEETFHDKKAQRTLKPENRPSARREVYPEWMDDEHWHILLSAAGSLRGKRVLDFGCGPGHSSRAYARQGAARVDGFDIAGENIRIAESAAEREGLGDRVFFRRLAAEEIDYPDESFDVVIGKAILHHTDLDKTAWQLQRVLRPGGTAFFLEPLAHNPLLNLYRRFTPWRRTPTEKPLDVDDLDKFRAYFLVSYEGFYLFTLLAHCLQFVSGSRTVFTRTRKALRRMEVPVLRRFPFVQRYCWSALIVLRKPMDGVI